MAAGEATAGRGNIGTPARPFFLGRGVVALRRDGRWCAQAVRYEAVQVRSLARGNPADWEDRALPTIRVPVWDQDEAAFAPVGDATLEEHYDRQAALRWRLGAWPPEWDR